MALMERTGVSAWDSPLTDTETLMAANYASITCTDNSVTTVTARCHISVLLRTVRPPMQKHSLCRARSGLRAARSDQPRACAAAATPGHRCFDQRYPHAPWWSATTARATAAVAALRERPTVAHIRPCSTRPASHWDQAACGPDARVASRRTCTRPALDAERVRRVPSPAASVPHGPGQAIRGG